MYRKERNAYWMWKSSWVVGSAAEAKRPGALPDVLLDLPRSAAPVKRPLLSAWGVKATLGRARGSGSFFFSYFFSVSFVLYSAEGRLVCPPGKAHPWLFVPYPVGGGYLDLVPFPAKLEVRGPANVC